MRHACLPLLLLGLLAAGPAHAGPYSDELGRCLVASTTTADKNALVKWMFATVSLHPAVKSIASVTPAERAGFNRDTARLFERLVTESCKAPTRQALKYEGPAALQVAFQFLGQVAARELFADPAVAGGMSDLERHFDKQKLEAAFAAPQP